jgi:hypothetical protein
MLQRGRGFQMVPDQAQGDPESQELQVRLDE